MKADTFFGQGWPYAESAWMHRIGFGRGWPYAESAWMHRIIEASHSKHKLLRPKLIRGSLNTAALLKSEQVMSNLALANHFLIAMPDMVDPYFSETLSLICEHNEEGAMGFIVNRSLEIPAVELFEQQEIDFDPDSELARLPLYMGGPVQQGQGFILHSGDQRWESTLTVSDQFKITSSRDIIVDIAQGEGPDKFIILLGFAGWGNGQLENEILANSWLTSDADADIIFSTPVNERWQSAATKLGIDLNLISTDRGHA